MQLYTSAYRSPGGTEKTNELKRLFAAVKARTPAVTPCPSKDPFPADGRVRAVYYGGERSGGRQSRVFAYLGFPENASAARPVPAVVAVAGGGCHAWAEWVRYWVDHGYAAISPDGFGQHYVGPDRAYAATDPACWAVDPLSHVPMAGFTDREKPLQEQWFYHYIADMLLANSLLRADPRVDENRVGLTGISWGGVGAGTAVCYDDRFAFAAPVYGGGFLDRSGSPWAEGFGGPGVSDVWDAALLLPEVRTPVMWFNGDNDPFFSADCTTASAAASPNGAATLVFDLIHGMDQGTVLPELLRFANERTGMGAGNVHITDFDFNAEAASARFTLPGDGAAPELGIYYRFSPLDYEGPKRKDCPDLIEPWKYAKGDVCGGAGRVRIPAGTKLFYLAVSCTTPNGGPDAPIRATTGVFAL